MSGPITTNGGSWLCRLLCTTLVLCGLPAAAQTAGRAIDAAGLERLANGILGIMSYTVAPDVTTSSLAIDNAATANPGLTMTQVGGGFTWSQQTPLYLEGNAAYSRFDPVFLVSDGTDQRPVPVNWDSLSVTGGIGWDIPLAEHWTLRPIFSFTWVRSSANVTGDFGNVTDLGLGAGLRGCDCRSECGFPG